MTLITAIIPQMDLHTLQFIFYSLGSIFFILLIILILLILVILFIAKKKITEMTNKVEKKVVQARNLYDHKEKYILKLMGKGSSSLIEIISNVFVNKK